MAHNWIKYHGLLSCKNCGIVKRRDGRNKPCPGKVRVELRENRLKTGFFGDANAPSTDTGAG